MSVWCACLCLFMCICVFACVALLVHPELNNTRLPSLTHMRAVGHCARAVVSIVQLDIVGPQAVHHIPEASPEAPHTLHAPGHGNLWRRLLGSQAVRCSEFFVLVRLVLARALLLLLLLHFYVHLLDLQTPVEFTCSVPFLSLTCFHARCCFFALRPMKTFTTPATTTATPSCCAHQHLPHC